MKPVADVAAALVCNAPVGSSTPVHKMFRVVEAGLGYQYVSVWNLVLMVINQFFEVGLNLYVFFCKLRHVFFSYYFYRIDFIIYLMAVLATKTANFL